MNYEKIPAEEFAFVQENKKLRDQELETKAKGYFADAMLRFRKNKSSVIAAWILLFLVLFAIFAPVLSRYDVENKDKLYINYPAYVPAIAQLNLGILDGARTFDSQNDTAMLKWQAIAQETGMDPVLRVLNTHETEGKNRGQTVIRYTYDIEVNYYYATAMIYKVFSYAEFQALQDWQNETGIQVIYPYVNPKDIFGIADSPNIWYQVTDDKGTPKVDGNGNFIPAYSTDQADAGAEYSSLRIPGDDGSYAYSIGKAGAVQCRVLY